MTHSGQGDEQRLPAARPAHEGVVLPADGSEPLIPGAPGAQAAPAGGQPWGDPWGPQQPSPGPGYGYPGPQAPGGPATQGYGHPGVQPGATQSHPGAPAPTDGYGYPAAHAQSTGYGYPAPPAPGTGYSYPPAPTDGYGYPAAPAQGTGYGYPAAPAPSAGYGYPGGPAQPGGHAAPHQPPAHTAPQGHTAPPAHAAPPAQPGVYAQPLPPRNAPGAMPSPAAAQPGPYGQPPQAPRDAQQGGYGDAGSGAAPGGLPQETQGGHPQQQFPQHRQPAPAPTGDSDATQYIAPVGPGALPPEMPAESTTFLGTGPLAAGDGRGAPQGGAGSADNEATQYIAPVPGGNGLTGAAPAAASFGVRPGAPGERQPPAEFDSLFRSEGAGGETADATQQMPRFDEHQAGHRQPPGHEQPRRPSHQQQRHDQSQYTPAPEPRRRSTAPVVAALVIGCAVLGLGVGAVAFSGDDDKDPAPDTNVAVDSPASSSPAPAPKAADPAEPQARELDKLLADSNNSRSAVIRSVENIKVCKNLDQAAADLKGAAQQRRNLVTRLGRLSVDKLPDNAALTAALTKAWQASASADDHYAVWAEQTKGKKGCKGGKARVTSHTAQGNAASGEATRAKNEAVPLWNSVARKYKLTERTSSQL